MFTRQVKKGKSRQLKPLKELTKIIASELLLAEEKRASLLKQIQDTCSLESSRYESLCLTLIHHLVNHCQSLPETSNSYYAYAGGLLDHALNRTEAALSLFRQFVVKEGKSDLSEEQKPWEYALFSAALLQGIGKLYIDLSVDIYDNQGVLLKPWNPLMESLAAIGSHYAYCFQKESDVEFRRRLNLLLARFLMPASGFSWIAQDPKILSLWLALLNEDYHAAGTLGAILIRADAIAIQRYFNQWLIRNYGSRTGRYGRVSTFAGGVPESISDLEQQMGIEFIQWLTKALEAGKIVLNKAPLFMVPGGLLMCPEVFRMFIKDHPEYKNWQAIQNAFLSLGLHKIAADGNVVFRFEQNRNQQMQSGIVFTDFAIALPQDVHCHQLATGNTQKMSATETIYQAQFNTQFTSQQVSQQAASLLYLNAQGQWQAPPAPVLLVKPGASNNV